MTESHSETRNWSDFGPSGYTTADVGLILDHGKREDDDGEYVTARHYAFSKAGKKAWRMMRDWVAWVDEAAYVEDITV